MTRMVLISGILVAALLAAIYHAPAGAEQAHGVKIVLVQAAGADAKLERIDIQNQTDKAVDLTAWKILYKSSSGNSTSQLMQFSPAPQWHILIGPDSRETLLSKEYAAVSPIDPGLAPPALFTAGMNHQAGSIQIVDSQGVVIDMVGWGAAVETVRMGTAAPAMTQATWLVRQAATGNNADDFILEKQDNVLRPVSFGALYEVHDQCRNIVDIQLTVPDAYHLINGDCVPIDACFNLEGIQEVIPKGMEYQADEECVPIDVCKNLEGIQEEVPSEHVATEGRMCEVMMPPRLLLITEILPNPSGSDIGNEYIEFYNADTVPVTLEDYKLAIGNKIYSLPNRLLQPAMYLTISDVELGTSLPNTTGLPMWLLTAWDIEVAAVPAYVNAKDDVSWALIDGQWQYTYMQTPGEPNIAMDTPVCQEGLVRDMTTNRCRKGPTMATVSLASCRDGQYRHEETGRCRNIPAAIGLMPCKEGQYRSEETNRCRSLLTAIPSTLRSCADDQFRNPLTNRCKKIASSEEVALADCGEGRERNPATNRCRNVTKVTTPTAAFAVEPVEDAAAAFVGWWAIGGVGILALGYAGWEWRREVAVAVSRIRQALIVK